MLEVIGLDAGYGHVQILRNIDINVKEGEIVAILGSNGAGKSTLNNNISGIYRPFAGHIRFLGKDIGGQAPKDIVSLGLVQVPEGRRLFPNLSILENLEVGSYRRGKANRARNISRVLEIFPRLKERLKQPAGTLSGGEQQMVAISRGLMAEPKLLILDEPSLGLSPLLVEQMFDLIKKINDDGLSIVLVEQNVMQSLRLADRAYVIENGVVTLSGNAEDLFENDQLKKSYLGI
jgi:branched-chain amino acid transport system ATP-binding protein|tara:strand:- start:29 stop:730 length:702 start_codon:yes stop_codon:yes gene_type:complete